jgi:hypothetical protein
MSCCPNFVTPDTEYVPMNHLNESRKKPNDRSDYQFTADAFFVGEWKQHLDMTLLLDYIILNEDRHFGNFGLIRDVNTGEFVSPAPIFDSGSSMYYDSRITSVIPEAKPFSKDFEKQLGYIDARPFLEGLMELSDCIGRLVDECFTDEYETAERAAQIKRITAGRVQKALTLARA